VKRTPLSTQPYQSGPDEVKAKFGAALAAQPRREATFTLHFAEGRDEISEESRVQLDAALADIAARPVKDVLVIGHTDRVGSDPVNDSLARQRAETVRAELIRRGVDAENVQASGRGSRDPVVPTGPGVAEPRNRRVEIIVR
jgi:OOP family OmpA-OmpF porin